MSGDQPRGSKDLSSLFKLLSFPAVTTTPLAPKPVAIFEAMPPFPLETLPPNVRAVVESSTASARARRELIAAPFLALAGAAIGNQAAIEVSQGWIEGPVLWVSLVAPTGAGKSPALAAARLPFDRLHERISGKRPIITTDATMEAIVETLRTAPGIADLLQTLHTLRDRYPDGLYITRDRDAGAVWVHWYNENVERMHAAPACVRGFYQKLPAHVARLALVLHLLWHPDDAGMPLSAATMTHAVTLGEFFRIHIHRQARILGEHAPIPDAKPTLEDRIARVLAEVDTSDGWLTRTEIYNLIGRPTRTELAAALETLHDRNAITTRSITAPNAKCRTTEYRAS